MSDGKRGTLVSSPVNALLILAFLFSLSAYAMYHVYLNFPSLTKEELDQLSPPEFSTSDLFGSAKNAFYWLRGLDNLKRLGKVLSVYSDQYYYEIMSAYVSCYIFLQSFAIPGSASLSLLGGALFGFNVGMLLVCICSSIGALNCYFLSMLVGSPFISRYQDSPRLRYLSEEVKKQKGHLLSYILFLRITPLLPNWFINITSPHVGIPPGYYFVGTFFGVIPLSFIPVNAGLALQTLTSFDDFSIWRPNVILTIFATAFAACLPTIVMKLYGNDYSQDGAKPKGSSPSSDAKGKGKPKTKKLN